MSLNAQTNKYCCCRCGAGGYSIGLYAKVKGIDTKKAYKELLERECFSVDKSKIKISPINLLADIEQRNAVYMDFLNMLKLDLKHKKYLNNIGFLDSSIEHCLFKTIPKNYIKRRLIAHSLSKNHNLCGIPGFYQEEDFMWNFNRIDGFFVPVFDDNGYIKELSIHLDTLFNNSSDIWFSSNNKINGTNAKNLVMRNNIAEDSNSVILTDNFLLGHLIIETINFPVIAFQNISNSYTILKEIENTKISNIIFALQISKCDKNIDYIINRIFKDLLPLGYNLDIKYVRNYKDFLEENFSENYTLKKVA